MGLLVWAAGLFVSLPAVPGSPGPIRALLLIKLAAKAIGVSPHCARVQLVSVMPKLSANGRLIVSLCLAQIKDPLQRRTRLLGACKHD